MAKAACGTGAARPKAHSTFGCVARLTPPSGLPSAVTTRPRTTAPRTRRTRTREGEVAALTSTSGTVAGTKPGEPTLRA